jgi:hypothetical protein
LTFFFQEFGWCGWKGQVWRWVLVAVVVDVSNEVMNVVVALQEGANTS